MRVFFLSNAATKRKDNTRLIHLLCNVACGGLRETSLCHVRERTEDITTLGYREWHVDVKRKKIQRVDLII